MGRWGSAAGPLGTGLRAPRPGKCFDFPARDEEIVEQQCAAEHRPRATDADADLRHARSEREQHHESETRADHDHPRGPIALARADATAWRQSAAGFESGRIVSNVCLQARATARAPAGAPPRLESGATDMAFADLELRDRLEKAMEQLPENYRLLVAAHYLQGVQYEALAEALNIPVGTVKTHLYRAKRRLRELLS